MRPAVALSRIMSRICSGSASGCFLGTVRNASITSSSPGKLTVTCWRSSMGGSSYSRCPGISSRSSLEKCSSMMAMAASFFMSPDMAMAMLFGAYHWSKKFWMRLIDGFLRSSMVPSVGHCP